MSATAAEQLSELVRQYYPQEIASEEPLVDREDLYERSPEHQRWKEAWNRARKDQPWNVLSKQLEEQFPAHRVESYVPEYMAGGYSCFISMEAPLAEGGHRLTRVGGAISILAPLYLLFGTTELVTREREEALKRVAQGGWTFFQRIQPQLFLPPPPELRDEASTVARSIERTLGYHSLPTEFAHIAVPGVHVPHLHRGKATLLNTLFMSDAALFLTMP